MNGETVTCAVCGATFKRAAQYAHVSGLFYCTAVCYQTLFQTCGDCDALTMETAADGGAVRCRACFLTFHGLTLQTIKM